MWLSYQQNAECCSSNANPNSHTVTNSNASYSADTNSHPHSHTDYNSNPNYSSDTSNADSNSHAKPNSDGCRRVSVYHVCAARPRSFAVWSNRY